MKMEPISIAASFIAFGQAVGMIPKIVDALRSARHLSDELAALLNELSTLQAIHLSVQESIEAVSGPTGMSQPDLAESPLLCKTRIELCKLIDDLQKLTDGCTRRPDDRGLHRPRRVKMMWKSKEISRLIDRSRAICIHINLALSTFSLLSYRTQSKLLLEVHSITTTSTAFLRAGSQGDQNIGIMLPLDAKFQPTTATAVDPIYQIKQHQGLDNSELGYFRPATYPLHDLEFGLSNVHARSQCAESSFVEVKTSLIYRNKCDPSCQCQCHSRGTDFRCQGWSWPVLGRLFLSYSSLPFPRRRKCDYKGCRGSSPKIHLLYHFPSWAWNRVISIYLCTSSILGQGVSLNIRVPRVFPIAHADAWSAAWGGNLNVLKYWLSKHTYSPFDVQEDGASLLVHSIRASQKDIIEFLIEFWGIGKRMDCDALAIYHATLLSESTESSPARSGDSFSESLCKLVTSGERNSEEQPEPELHQLIQHGSDISHALDEQPWALHCCDRWQRGPLTVACQSGNVKAAKALIRLGASLDKPDILGRTPLIWAARHHEGDRMHRLVEMLLDAGCNVNAMDNSGLPALYYAMKSNLTAELFLILKRLIMKTDIRSYNQSSYNNPYRQNPLHWFACSIRAREPVTESVLRLLLNAGARLDAPDARGHIPLQRAIARNNVVGFRLLLYACGQVDAEKFDRYSILQTAAAYAGAEIFDELRSAEFTENMGFDLSNDKEASEIVRTFLQRLATPEDTVNHTPRPAAEDITSFESLIKDIRDRSLRRQIDTLNQIIQAVDRKDSVIALQVLNQSSLMKGKQRQPPQLEKIKTFKLQLRESKWGAANETIEKMIQGCRERMEISPLREASELNEGEMTT